ncbi:MAG: ExbD/TolR family protein [Flavobacteriales bacterium]
MARSRSRKPLPEINSGSMADIAFLLLIFFLVTTTMDQEFGLPRELPRKIEEQIPPPPVKERNVLLVYVNRNNDLLVNNEYGDIKSLKESVKTFVANKTNRTDWPEKDAPEEFGSDGHTFVFQKSKGIVALQNDRLTTYKTYITVQDVLTQAFNELRNELAKEKYGKTFDELNQLSTKGQTDDIQEEAEIKVQAIQKAIPMAISEAEPIKSK